MICGEKNTSLPRGVLSSPDQSSKRDASQQPVGQSRLVLSLDCPLSPWAEIYCPLSLHRAFCEGKGTQPAGERGRFSPPAIRELASSFCPVPGTPIDVPKLKTPSKGPQHAFYFYNSFIQSIPWGILMLIVLFKIPPVSLIQGHVSWGPQGSVVQGEGG